MHLQEIFALQIGNFRESFILEKLCICDGQITLSFTDVGKHVLVSANMSFNAICENKILAKISEFTRHDVIKPLKHQ